MFTISFDSLGVDELTINDGFEITVEFTPFFCVCASGVGVCASGGEGVAKRGDVFGLRRVRRRRRGGRRCDCSAWAFVFGDGTGECRRCTLPGFDAASVVRADEEFAKRRRWG